jgi:hypothetical protein
MFPQGTHTFHLVPQISCAILFKTWPSPQKGAPARRKARGLQRRRRGRAPTACAPSKPCWGVNWAGGKRGGRPSQGVLAKPLCSRGCRLTAQALECPGKGKDMANQAGASGLVAPAPAGRLQRAVRRAVGKGVRATERWARRGRHGPAVLKRAPPGERGKLPMRPFVSKSFIHFTQDGGSRTRRRGMVRRRTRKWRAWLQGPRACVGTPQGAAPRCRRRAPCFSRPPRLEQVEC